jgi:hypothetical protein
MAGCEGETLQWEKPWMTGGIDILGELGGLRKGHGEGYVTHSMREEVVTKVGDEARQRSRKSDLL